MSLKQLAPQEILGLATVICALGYTYMHSGFLVICAIAGKKTARIKFWEKAVIVLSASFTVCFLYALFVEPYWLEVKHITLGSPKLSTKGGKIRLAVISDLHCDDTRRLEPALPGAIEKEHPDIILFAGDAINNAHGAVPIFKECISALSKIAPVYLVEGNHDTRDFAHINIADGTGATLLRSNATDIKIRQQSVHLIGNSVDYEKGLAKLFSSLDPKLFNIFVYHFPAEILSASKFPIDLMITGHTHGGQVCLPFYGAIVTHSKTSKRYESGLYRLNDTWLYVNRGIGMDGGLSPRVRFLARPELTIIDIVADPTATGAYKKTATEQTSLQDETIR
jgi:predicted MPP superfamily phosphohydrolase